jgi:hypothetical protein
VLTGNEIAVLAIVCSLIGAVLQGIGSAAAPLVQAAIEAHKEKMPAL